jgi:hypothetical protein
MELHAIGGMFTMLESHDLAFGGGGNHLQFRGDGFVYDKRVIAHPFEGRRYIFEDSLPIVIHFGCFAMHQARGTVHFAAVDGAETLMSETDSEHGDLSGEMSDRIRGNAVIFERFAGSRGDDEVGRVEGDELIHRDLVVAEDFDIRAKFAEVLDKVVGKGVVVVY